MSAPRVVRFGTFEFDVSTSELRSKGRRVALQSQPAQVLALLLSNPGQIVTREQLRAAIWSDDTFVEFDTSLNVAVNKIRQSLRDSANAPRFVETIPKRGYRFLADVHPIAAEASIMPSAQPVAATSVSRAVRPWRSVGLALAALVGSVTLAAVWSGTRVGDANRPYDRSRCCRFAP